MAVKTSRTHVRAASGHKVSANGAPAANLREVEGIPPKTDDFVKALRVGLRFKKEMPYDAWRALGTRLATRADSSTWWLGDWIVFGERNYRRYEEAIDNTGLEYQTLRNYAAVARRFALSRRRDNLTFQHHAEVCALPDEDQDRWLDIAIEQRWSSRELRRRLREVQDESHKRASHVVRFEVDAEREQRWRAAASASGCRLEDWIVQKLDAAVVEIPAQAP